MLENSEFSYSQEEVTAARKAEQDLIANNAPIEGLYSVEWLKNQQERYLDYIPLAFYNHDLSAPNTEIKRAYKNISRGPKRTLPKKNNRYKNSIKRALKRPGKKIIDVNSKYYDSGFLPDNYGSDVNSDYSKTLVDTSILEDFSPKKKTPLDTNINEVKLNLSERLVHPNEIDNSVLSVNINTSYSNDNPHVSIFENDKGVHYKINIPENNIGSTREELMHFYLDFYSRETYYKYGHDEVLGWAHFWESVQHLEIFLDTLLTKSAQNLGIYDQLQKKALDLEKEDFNYIVNLFEQGSKEKQFLIGNPINTRFQYPYPSEEILNLQLKQSQEFLNFVLDNPRLLSLLEISCSPWSKPNWEDRSNDSNIENSLPSFLEIIMHLVDSNNLEECLFKGVHIINAFQDTPYEHFLLKAHQKKPDITPKSSDFNYHLSSDRFEFLFEATFDPNFLSLTPSTYMPSSTSLAHY